MTIRFITFDFNARTCEVTDLFDKFGERTTDPILASSCVVKLDHDHWVPQDANNIPIYSVH